MALGAQKGDVLLRVLLSTIGVVGVGAAAGIGLYMLVNRVVARWAYAPADDPLSLALVAPLLLCVATLACYVPARRAMSLDPMNALRCE
jgi:putative ABC transport system permease protein